MIVKKLFFKKSFDFPKFRKKALETLSIVKEVRNQKSEQLTEKMSKEEIDLVVNYYNTFYQKLSLND